MSTKSEVRTLLEARRRALTPAEVASKGAAAQAALAALPAFAAARTIALYAGQGFEVPTDRLWAGKRVCLPRVVPGQRTLSFHLVTDPSRLVARGKLKLLEPADDAEPVALPEIDLWVVPGTGFTPRGERIGRGAGYYDATLSAARASAPKIGLTWDCQVVDALPTEPHDVTMDAIVTETRVLHCRSANTHE